MKFGVNLLLFDDAPTPAVLGQFGRLRDLGFDGVEVPIFAPGTIDTERVRRHAERHGLAITASGALPPGARFYGSAASRKRAERYLLGAIRVCQELGAGVFCGPLYKPVGDTDESLSLPVQRRETAKALAHPVADAESRGVVLAFEPLNRFETNFLNTVDDAVAFARALDSSAAGLLLDTFHMHIEEKDTAAAIARAGRARAIAHFHACENDRGAAGSGQVHWAPVAKALRRSGYDGWVVLESFSQTNQIIRKAVSCWRPFYASPLEFCRDGVRFMRKRLGAASRR